MIQRTLDGVHQQKRRDTEKGNTGHGQLLRLVRKAADAAGNRTGRALRQHRPLDQQIQATEQHIEIGDGTRHRKHHGNQRHQCHQGGERQRRTRLHHVLVMKTLKYADGTDRLRPGSTITGVRLHGAV